MPSPVICPLCRSALLRDARTWRCAEGHAFDVAREGYVNLLPVQHRKSRAPGDNADMVRARRAFLDAGHYAPLREAIAALVQPLNARRVVDIGCGEGYYTGALCRPAAVGVSAPGGDDDRRDGSTRDDECFGIDISREAIQRAAKRYPGITWLVAGSASLTLADHGVELAASLFAPVPAAEIARVLAPGGHLLIATPSADHLQALREALFETVIPHAPDKLLAALPGVLVQRETRDVRFELDLNRAAIGQLLLMTPYGWRATRERRDALAARDNLQTVAAFTLHLLTKAE